MTQHYDIAYLSMEVGLQDAIPTYSGGLGVLAGDTLRAAADLGVPMIGITLLHREGYLRQRLDARGGQTALPVSWSPEQQLEELDARCEVEIEGRPTSIRAWRYIIEGERGHEVPVLLLDADLPGNDPTDRELTGRLYGGDDRYRLAQEVILGVGGRRMLRALGLTPRVFHLNEGHAALLALELLREHREAGSRSMREAIDAVRSACVFTTHTPVPAGHDRFESSLVLEVAGPELASLAAELPALGTDELNMTELCLELAGFVNGVAERHAEVSRAMFPGREIHAVTNGIHCATWTSPSFAALFDEHVPGWRVENARLRGAQAIELGEILAAHASAKQRLLEEIATLGGGRRPSFAPGVFTIGFARRATAYKRAALLLRDPERLRAIARAFGGLQIVYAGKAHPRDVGGQELIRRIHALAREVAHEVSVVYVPNYEMRLGGLITAGVDLWLNNPRAPLEASGTSGMKAALNGVPNLSVRDGWWCEGAIEGVTGWVIEPGDGHTALVKLLREVAAVPNKNPSAARAAAEAIEHEKDRRRAELEDAVDREDVAQIYDLLEHTILPLYHHQRMAWAAVMRGAIALAGSYFTAQRMVEEYQRLAYGATKGGRATQTSGVSSR